MTVTTIENILRACLSSDNAERKQAESNLTNSITQNPQQSATLLAEALCSQDETIRGFSAVLLRKKIVSDEKTYKVLDDNTKKGLMTLLLKQLEKEGSNQVRKKIGDLVFQLAVAHEGKWTDLTKFLVELVNKPCPAQQTALYILGELAAGTNMEVKDLETFASIAGQSFSSTNKEVKMEALTMFGKSICAMKAEDVEKYRTVVPSVLQLLTSLLQENDEGNAQKLLTVLIEIASANAVFYRDNMSDVVQICSALTTEKNFEPGVKSLGLEVLCSILENIPQIVRRNREFIEGTVRICFNLMLDIEEDTDWDNSYGNSVGDDENFDAGQVGLNRLSENINAKKFLPILMPKLSELITGTDWRMRHAGFIAMAQCCELFNENKQNGEELFQSIVGGMKDAHYRVRAAAIHCLGIMCSDFGKQFVNKFSSNILDIFEAGMDDIQHPRIQASAAMCIVNYTEMVSSKLLRPRLEQLVRKLVNLLSKPQKFLQENALCALSECAENAKDLFEKYYNDFTSHLMRILQEARSEEYVSVRLEALRCLSCIGNAVGAQTFNSHALQAMQISLQIIEQDGVEVSRILNCWSQIFKTCQEAMAPLVSQISQIVLRYASQTVKMIDFDSDDEEAECNQREQTVNATRVEEKVAAINLLSAITSFTKGHATALVEPAAKILLPIVDDPVDDSLQEAAAEALPGLVKCLFEAMKNGVNGITNVSVKCFFNTVLTKVTQALDRDESPDPLCSFAICIEKCIKINQELTKTLSAEMLNKIYGSLLNCLKESAQRMDGRNFMMNEGGQDDEDIEKLKEQNEQEAILSSNISDAVGGLVEAYGDHFLPILQTQ